MARRRRRTLALGIGLALVLSLAIGIGTAVAGKSSPAASPLRAACGSKIVVQTDWFPEPEHGFLYQLAGTNGTLDTKKGHYTGTIKGTGVQLEIRAGGPFTGFQQPISQMYQDSSITLGYATSDEEIQLAKKLPLVSVVAPDEFSPQILMWNPKKFPNVHRFADIKGTGAKVLVFAGGVWVDYLVGRGWVDQKQVDTSYDGSPARFVSSDGAIFQQGFATSEPYQYQHEISQYGKPVSYLLIKNSGYVPYPQTLAVRRADLKKLGPCLKLFVPLVQRAQVAYTKNPKPVNDKLTQIVTALNTFWKLTPGGNAYNSATQRKLGIVSNGPDCTLGNFSMKRLQQVIGQINPIFKAKGLDTINPNLKASDIATNRFVNPKIGLPKKGCK